MTARENDIYDRIRLMEGEMAEIMTRHLVETTRRNGENFLVMNKDIIAMKLQLDRMAGDVVLMQAAQPGQGEMLKTLVRDVRDMRTRLEAFERGATARFDRIDANIDAIKQAVAAIHAAVTPRPPQA